MSTYQQKIAEYAKTAEAFVTNLRVLKDNAENGAHFACLTTALEHFSAGQQVLSNEHMRLRLQELRSDDS